MILGIETCRSTYYHIKDCYLCNFNRNIAHLLVIINKYGTRYLKCALSECWKIKREFWCSNRATKNISISDISISDIRERLSSDWWLQHPRHCSNKWRPVIGRKNDCTTRHNHIDDFKIKVFAVLTMNIDRRGCLDHQRQVILKDCNSSTVGKSNTKEIVFEKARPSLLLAKTRKILEV